MNFSAALRRDEKKKEITFFFSTFFVYLWDARNKFSIQISALHGVNCFH